MAIKNKMVYRNGKPIIKQESDRPGYSVDYHDDGKSKEKRLTEKEKLRRKNGQKSGQKKRNGKMKEMQAKRQRTLEAKERNENYFQETLMLRDRTFYRGQTNDEIRQGKDEDGIVFWFTNNYAYAVMNALKIPYNFVQEKIKKNTNNIDSLFFNNFDSLYEKGYIFTIKTSKLNVFNFYDINDWKKIVEHKDELLEYGIPKGFYDELYVENTEYRKTLGRIDLTKLDFIKEKTRNIILKFISEKLDYDGVFNYEIKYDLNFQSIGLFHKSVSKVNVEDSFKIKAVKQGEITKIKADV